MRTDPVMDLEVALEGDGRVWLHAYKKDFAVDVKFGRATHTEVSLSPNAKTVNQLADMFEGFKSAPKSPLEQRLDGATIRVELTPRVTNQKTATLFVIRPASTFGYPCESAHLTRLIAGLRQIAVFAAKYPL